MNFISSLFLFFLIFLVPLEGVADLEDLSNPSYDKATVKHKAERDVRNSSCYFYTEIYGNKDWQDLKISLNNVIEEKPDCKKMIIYKIIKNVHATEKSERDQEYDYNLGLIIKDMRDVYGIEIETVTYIENSDIATGHFNSDINTGVHVDDPFVFDRAKIKNKTILINSNIGNKWFLD